MESRQIKIWEMQESLRDRGSGRRRFNKYLIRLPEEKASKSGVETIPKE